MAKKRSLKIFNPIDLHSDVPYFNFLNLKILCNWNVYMYIYVDIDTWEKLKAVYL